MGEFIKDFWGFMRVRKKYWILPILLVLILFTVLVVVGGGGVASPFVYTLF